MFPIFLQLQMVSIYVHNLVQVHKEFLLGGCLGVELLTHVASIHSTL